MSSRDRMTELNRKSSQEIMEAYAGGSIQGYTIPSRSLHPSRNPSRNPSRQTLNSNANNSFLDTAESIRKCIEKIDSNTQHLQALHKKALSEVQNQNQIIQDIHYLFQTTNELIQSTRTQIKGLLSIQGEQTNVKQTQQKVLAKKLMETAREFQFVQTAAKKSYKEQMVRQYKIARPNATNQQINQALSDTNGRVFQQEMVQARFGEQRAALEQVKSRNSEIELIESSINELFDLFQEMQMLLDTQQERIDLIDQHTDSAVVYLGEASTQLTAAIESAKSSRKKKWCCLILMIILIGIIAFIVYYYVISPALKASTPTSTPPTPT